MLIASHDLNRKVRKYILLVNYIVNFMNCFRFSPLQTLNFTVLYHGR